MNYLSLSAFLVLALVALSSAQRDNPARCAVANRQCNEGNENNCENYCRSNENTGISGECESADDPDDPDLMVCVCTRADGSTFVACMGDPHCRSADGNYWHPQPMVQMIAMENRYPTEHLPYFRLHTDQRSFGTVSIIREVQLEIYGLTIKIESYSQLPDAWKRYNPVKISVNGKELTDAKLPFLHTKKGRSGSYERVKVTRVNGYIGYIYTNVGMNIMLYGSYLGIWTMGTELMKNVRGFMGPAVKDGIKGNDFVYPNGTSIATWNYDQVLSWASDLPENQGPGKLGKIQAPKPFDGCKGPGVAAMKQMCKPYLLKKNQRNPFHRCLKANPDLFDNHFETCKMEVCSIITVDTKNEHKAYLDEFICNYLQDVADDCGNLVPDSWARGTFCDKVPRTNPGNAFGHVKNSRG